MSTFLLIVAGAVGAALAGLIGGVITQLVTYALDKKRAVTAREQQLEDEQRPRIVAILERLLVAVHGAMIVAVAAIAAKRSDDPALVGMQARLVTYRDEVVEVAPLFTLYRLPNDAILHAMTFLSACSRIVNVVPGLLVMPGFDENPNERANWQRELDEARTTADAEKSEVERAVRVVMDALTSTD